MSELDLTPELPDDTLIDRVRLPTRIRNVLDAAGLKTAVCFSTSAYAQAAPPKASNKPLVQVRPKEPMGCKLVGRVGGAKLWAGDCVSPELRGTIPSTETQSPPEPPTGAIPSDQKQ